MRWFKRISFILTFVFACFLIVALKENSMKQEDLEFAKSEIAKYSNSENQSAFIVIDYRLPIFKKRLWVYDQQNKVVLNCHVTHAHKSGLLYAKILSNTPETELSCEGVFETQEAYYGSFGKSMRINGLVPEINSNARARNIVFHPIPEFKVWGLQVPEWLLWYSDGCFATQESTMHQLVDNYANGTYVVVLK